MMRLNADILGLPRGTDTLLRDLVHDRTGIFFDAVKADILLDKLSPLVVRRGFSSFLDYYYLLKYDVNAETEWLSVMNAISVQETYFWREIDQIRALTDTVVPQWFASHRNETLRIWSAACATGEEPLTIAMALEEARWFDRAPIEIYASDASSAAIDKARQGIYRERSFRNLSQQRREKYFIDGSVASRVRPELQARVTYSVANLMNEGEIAGLAAAPVIFCRNVFIYFSQHSIAKAVDVFARHMPEPGFLFVGTSESLMRLRTAFVLEDVDDAFVYMKESREN